MQRILISILCLIANLTYEETNVMTVSIPDSNFEQKLIDLGIDSDMSINGQILESDALSVTGYLNVTDSGINDLTGINAFGNISVLDIGINTIDTIDLSALVQLVELRCFSTSLDTIIGLENLTSLEFIYCSFNNLTSLHISGLTNLVNVVCTNNQISSLQMQNLPNLVLLNCSSNQLTELVVPDNNSIELLSCSYNFIETLSLGNLPNLSNLSCRANEIDSLDLNGTPNLGLLDCSFNNLDSLNVSELPNLSWLDCVGNNLHLLDIRNGNFMNFTNFQANGNPSLECISVDDPVWSLQNWTTIDPTSSFSSDCSSCGSMTGQAQITHCSYYISANGDTLNASGFIIDTLTNQLACDSFLLIDISIVVPTEDSIAITACTNYLSPSGNQSYTESGWYSDTIVNAAGCDSMITINLTINQTSAAIIDTATCRNYIPPSGVIVLNESGTYFDTIPNVNGCDSIITIQLTILCSADSITVFACDAYILPSGKDTIFIDGFYMDTINNDIGYDSVLTIDVTILNSSSNSIDISTCGFYQVPSENAIYTVSGVYQDTLINQAGCDSFLTIHLTLLDEQMIDREWNGVGSGLYGTGSSIEVDGNENVFVCGSFQTSSGAPGQNIATWDGTSWHALGAGLPQTGWAMVLDEENNEVYAGGQFSGPLKWDGSTWSVVGWPSNPGHTFALERGSNGHIYAGGPFAGSIKKWDGNSWSTLGSGLNGTCYAIASAANGDLYAAGFFTMAGGIPANNIAKWDGVAWTALGDGLNNFCQSIAVDNLGNVYAGGGFTMAGGTAVNKVAKWDGNSWLALGTGVNSSCREVAIDQCNNVYFGGDFTMAGNLAANRIAKWDGMNWDTLNAGIEVSNGFIDGITFNANNDVYTTGSFFSFFNSVAVWRDGPCSSMVDTSAFGALNNVFGCVSSGDSITFDDQLIGDTIVLSAPIIIDLEQVSIIADKSWNITIDASGLDQAFIVYSGSTFLLEGIKILSGTHPNVSAILNVGDLTLKDVTIVKHPSNPNGPLILNQGQLTLINLTEIEQ